MALIKVIMLLFLAGIIMALEVITTSAKQSSIPSEQSKLDDWIDHNMRAYEKDKTDLSETINNKLTLDKALTAAEHAVRVVKVSQDGKGDFNTITDAVNSIPSGNTGRVVVWISGGVYCEHIMIDRTKPFVTLYGDEDNVPNSSPLPKGKLNGEQAVAMRISGDKAAFHNCKFVGFQDTLCDDKGRHFFSDCYG
ncbi:hypothetical protein G4B88_016096 [Cannabis sativa]|uniref:pectinesterase n=1 Tax=Cannabis sativa TaxID=3483 RepID=A0A7J6FGZ6_CANSA|nr:hypothetical protein G4B88_016096 [Cannabis sativa]